MASRQPYPIDHSTHLPILIGLGALLPIRRVLEYGAGYFSTPLFLNTNVFPSVELVVTVEQDMEWVNRVQMKTDMDPRIVFQSDDVVYTPFDLVFIDNSPAEARVATINKIVREPRGLIVIHDSEWRDYKKEISEVAYRHDFSTFNPETSVCCGRIISPSVALIGNIIMSHRDVFPDDIPAWIRIFKEAL